MLGPVISAICGNSSGASSLPEPNSVVWHEPFLAQVSFQNRMTTVADLQNAVIQRLADGNNREVARFPQRTPGRPIGQGARGFLNVSQTSEGVFTDPLKYFVFQFQGAFFCAENFAFHFL